MIGMKVDYENMQIEIRDDLTGDEEGYRFYKTIEEAKVHEQNVQYGFLRQEWNALEDYDSPRAIELEKLLWGREHDFKEGSHRAKAKLRKS